TVVKIGKTGWPARESPLRRADLAGAGLLLLALLLAYANSWSVPFLFDDLVTIVDNPTLREPWTLRTLFEPAPHTGVGGRPLAHLSLMFNYAAGGESVRGYHAVNLAVHVCAALALFGLVRRTLQLPSLAPRFGAAAGPTALMVAGLWALHPVHTQSVTYISQRTEALMGLCYFVTLYGFVRGCRSPAPASWLALSVAACLAGVASKEVMVTAPVAVVLFDCAFVSGSIREAWQMRGRYYLGLGATWLLLAWLLRGLGGRGVGFGLGTEWWGYALLAGRAIGGYLLQSVWPHPLLFDHGVDLGPVGAAEFLGSGFALMLAGLAVLGLWRRQPWGFPVAWVLLTLAPTTSIVPIPLQPISENRMYLPLAGLAALLVVSARALVPRAGSIAWPVAGVALGALTFARNADYRSEVAIWTDTVAKRPGSSRAHHNLGNALREAGRPADAARSFAEALRLKPDYAEAAAALGGVMGQLGRFDEALRHCEDALRIDPNTVAAHNNRGGALWRKGDLAGAIAAYETAVRLRPGYAVAQANLAYVFLLSGRLVDAVAASEAALRAKPGLHDAKFSRACGLAGLGRLAEAAAAFEEYLRLRPGHVEARFNLATVMLQAGRGTEAIEVFQEVLRQDPRHTKAHSNLASALLGAGRVAEALGHGETAVQQQPDFLDARLNFGVALRRAGRAAEAVAQFEAALRIDPNSTLARTHLAELRAPGGVLNR
ncbi:MAG: tetratricopeptide repeat protein, partial [Verrucomicrobia bacterium]|nr:tetratricopeptide repeat protein [Verrucomicrobiota bacterium]